MNGISASYTIMSNAGPGCTPLGTDVVLSAPLSIHGLMRKLKGATELTP